MGNSIQEIFSQEISSIEFTELQNIQSISNLVALKKCGIFGVCLSFADGSEKKLIIKSKSNSVLLNGIDLLSKSSFRLKIKLLLHHKILSYNKSYYREISIYKGIDPSLKKYLINYHGYYTDRVRRTYNLVYDYYAHYSSKLTLNTVKRILDNIVSFHSLYFNDFDSARSLKLNIFTEKEYRKSKSALKALYNVKHEENLKYFGAERNARILSFADNIDTYMSKYFFHRTFTHNDFSTRNIFYDDGKVLFYDFELACYQNPEHDLIEFLIYDSENFSRSEILELISYYREMLLSRINVSFTDSEYRELLLYNTYEFIIIRLSMLRVIGSELNIDFIEKLLINSNKLLDILEV